MDVQTQTNLQSQAHTDQCRSSKMPLSTILMPNTIAASNIDDGKKVRKLALEKIVCGGGQRANLGGLIRGLRTVDAAKKEASYMYQTGQWGTIRNNCGGTVGVEKCGHLWGFSRCLLGPQASA